MHKARVFRCKNRNKISPVKGTNIIAIEATIQIRMPSFCQTAGKNYQISWFYAFYGCKTDFSFQKNWQISAIQKN
jgi:hypothetical protein